MMSIEISDPLKVIDCGTVRCTAKGYETELQDILVYGNYCRMYVARFPEGNFPDGVFPDEDEPDFDFESLNGENIPLNNIYPIFDPNMFTKAPDPLPPRSFIKSAKTISYALDGKRDEKISNLILYEGNACEQVKSHPHPNIAKYLGCRVINDRIIATCFVEYKWRLHERVQSDDSSKSLSVNKCLDDIRMGMEHLHRIGYAHNDINPRNIMFDDDDRAILIDFDSCRPFGTKLSVKAKTGDFNDKQATTSKKENDFYSLKMVGSFLKKLYSAKFTPFPDSSG